MAKEILKKAGISAIETTIRELLPELMRRLESIDNRLERLETRVNDVDRGIDTLRLEMKDDLHNQWDKTLTNLNQLGERMARVEGQFDRVGRGLDRQSDNMEKWIERLVKVEMTQTSRKRRAG
jgi:archaellum component FlaC